MLNALKRFAVLLLCYVVLPAAVVALALGVRLGLITVRIALDARTFYVLAADEHKNVTASADRRTVGRLPVKLPFGWTIRSVSRPPGFALVDTSGPVYEFRDKTQPLTCSVAQFDRTVIKSDFERILYGYFRGRPLPLTRRTVWTVILREFAMQARTDDLNLGPSNAPLTDFTDLPANEAAIDVAHVRLTLRFCEDEPKIMGLKALVYIN